MKKFTDLTVEEKADLTQEEINTYVDYRCAELGAPLVPAKPAEVAATKIPKTEKYYEVSVGWRSYFREADAKAIVDFINKFQAYETKNIEGYDSPQYITVAPEGGSDRANYSLKSYHTVGDAAKQHEADQIEKNDLTAYKENNKLYEDALEQRKEHQLAIADEVAEACRLIAKKEAYLADWVKYLELALNDEEIATNFFVARYSPTIFAEVIEPTLEDAILEETEVQLQPI